ncbi:helix-turn-helix domain-containing protein [Nocardia arizonensis]|uniref:helix-turn-helix domain-containing protein n=1 Tax=Nocardia arizonensis TaxID=1141647 RepID=UPI0006CF81F7|nr:helix-turn-helix transcriptional regulator [Nocardia arizonensis]
MADKKNPLGPTGETVRQNLKRLRQLRNLTYAELSRRLEDIRPIPVLGLSRIEKGDRRVDADDLMALSIALEAPPAALLMPRAEDETTLVDVSGSLEPITAEALWRWLTVHNLPDDRLTYDLLHTLPDWVAMDIELGRGTWARGVPSEQVAEMVSRARVEELKRLMIEGWRPPRKAERESDNGDD